MTSTLRTTARTAARLALATGLAGAALTLSAAAAHAEGPNGPGTIHLGPNVDPDGPVIGLPTPAPEPEPQVDGPDEVAQAPHCTHGCGGGNGGGNADDLDSTPTKDDQPAPQDDAPDQGCFEGCDLPEEPAANEPTTNQGASKADEHLTGVTVRTPNRVDAGVDSAATSAPSIAPSTAPDDATGLGWYVGLGLFSAAGSLGVALAARRLHEKAHRA